MKTTQFSIVFFVLLALCLAGCRNDPFGATRVTGTVTLDGTPVEGVNVAFLPTGGAGMRDCYGLTDAQGAFVITIPGAEHGSGAMPGEYVVTLSKTKDPLEGKTSLDGLSGEELDKELARLFPRGLPGPVDLLPAKYGNRRDTPIAPVKVEKGKKNDFTFELSTK